MIHTNFPRFVLMLSFNLALVLGYSQSSRQAIILINNNPVKAEIAADGTVKVIENLGNVDLSGFSLKESDYVTYLKNIAPKPKDSPQVTSVQTNSELFLIDVAFDPKSEVLSDQAIASLESIIIRLRENPTQGIVLKTLQHIDKAKIHYSRSMNIKSYLILRGIPESKIKFEPAIAKEDANEVKIYFENM